LGRKHCFDRGVCGRTRLEPSRAPTVVSSLVRCCRTHLQAPLLWLLSRRYANDNIYTFTSEMVVSINPYKNIEGLYNMSRFLEQSTSDEHLPPPHLFTVAHRASLRLLQGESQSILMSGESGAGKTEASKHVLRFLVNASSAFRSDGGYVGVQVEQCLVGSIPLLETFGNARTVNNGEYERDLVVVGPYVVVTCMPRGCVCVRFAATDNSSRFGKFMKIHYAAEGSISGAKQETFLLEKTRVVAQDEDEANFHIFYHLLNGASDELRTELKLDQDFECVTVCSPMLLCCIGGLTVCVPPPPLPLPIPPPPVLLQLLVQRARHGRHG